MRRREAMQAVAGGAAGLLVPFAGLSRATALGAYERAVLDALEGSWNGSPVRLTERVIAANAMVPPDATRAALTELERDGYVRRDGSGLWRRRRA